MVNSFPPQFPNTNANFLNSEFERTQIPNSSPHLPLFLLLLSPFSMPASSQVSLVEIFFPVTPLLHWQGRFSEELQIWQINTFVALLDIWPIGGCRPVSRGKETKSVQDLLSQLSGTYNDEFDGEN
ncbi:uncharacterized protein LOC130730584 [Lotus japonicus]|uniref:uncharacterized protein LOC130730584 n=1 Tax=Lotus japonicus TaxID=34305 RepID=UPI002582E953|nr:uncharacterized protein LOC130730584 [Lotus japonicus]